MASVRALGLASLLVLAVIGAEVPTDGDCEGSCKAQLGVRLERCQTAQCPPDFSDDQCGRLRAECRAEAEAWFEQCQVSCEPPPPTCEEKCVLHFADRAAYCRKFECDGSLEECAAKRSACFQAVIGLVDSCKADCGVVTTPKPTVPTEPPVPCRGQCVNIAESERRVCAARDCSELPADDAALCQVVVDRCFASVDARLRVCFAGCVELCTEQCRSDAELRLRRCDSLTNADERKQCIANAHQALQICVDNCQPPAAATTTPPTATQTRCGANAADGKCGGVCPSSEQKCVAGFVDSARCACCNPNPRCPLVIEPVCGSDGKVYPNACAFNGARCRNPALTQVACPTKPPPPLTTFAGPTPTCEGTCKETFGFRLERCREAYQCEGGDAECLAKREQCVRTVTEMFRQCIEGCQPEPPLTCKDKCAISHRQRFEFCAAIQDPEERNLCHAKVALSFEACVKDCQPAPPACKDVCHVKFEQLAAQCATGDLACLTRARNWLQTCLARCDPPPPTCEQRCESAFSAFVRRCEAIQCATGDEDCWKQKRECFAKAKESRRSCLAACQPPPPTCPELCKARYAPLWELCETDECRARVRSAILNCIEGCNVGPQPTCEDKCAYALRRKVANCLLLDSEDAQAACVRQAHADFDLCKERCTPPPPTCEEKCVIQAKELVAQCYEAHAASGDDLALRVCVTKAARVTALCHESCKPPQPSCRDRCHITYERAAATCHEQFQCARDDADCQARLQACLVSAREKLAACVQKCADPEPPTCEKGCEIRYERELSQCTPELVCDPDADSAVCARRITLCKEAAALNRRKCLDGCKDPEPPTCLENCRSTLARKWETCREIQCPIKPRLLADAAVAGAAALEFDARGNVQPIGACAEQQQCFDDALAAARQCAANCNPPPLTCTERCQKVAADGKQKCGMILDRLERAACVQRVESALTKCRLRCPCEPAECGPRPGLPTRICPDGTIGGLGSCARNDDFTCAWQVRECPTRDPSATTTARPGCPDGQPPVLCIANPCNYEKCPKHPTAVCRPNYCGGCNAEFFLPSGDEVTDDCEPTRTTPAPTTPRPTRPADVCPKERPHVECFVEPCSIAKCPSNPEATCRNFQCGGCFARFFDAKGNQVQCFDEEIGCEGRCSQALRSNRERCNAMQCPADASADECRKLREICFRKAEATFEQCVRDCVPPPPTCEEECKIALGAQLRFCNAIVCREGDADCLDRRNKCVTSAQQAHVRCELKCTATTPPPVSTPAPTRPPTPPTCPEKCRASVALFQGICDAIICTDADDRDACHAQQDKCYQKLREFATRCLEACRQQCAEGCQKQLQVDLDRCSQLDTPEQQKRCYAYAHERYQKCKEHCFPAPDATTTPAPTRPARCGLSESGNTCGGHCPTAQKCGTALSGKCGCCELRPACPRNLDPVCDQHGNQYSNLCLLEAAHCRDASIVEAPCPTPADTLPPATTGAPPTCEEQCKSDFALRLGRCREQHKQCVEDGTSRSCDQQFDGCVRAVHELYRKCKDDCAPEPPLSCQEACRVRHNQASEFCLAIEDPAEQKLCFVKIQHALEVCVARCDPDPVTCEDKCEAGYERLVAQCDPRDRACHQKADQWRRACLVRCQPPPPTCEEKCDRLFFERWQFCSAIQCSATDLECQEKRRSCLAEVDRARTACKDACNPQPPTCTELCRARLTEALEQCDAVVCEAGDADCVERKRACKERALQRARACVTECDRPPTPPCEEKCQKQLHENIARCQEITDADLRQQCLRKVKTLYEACVKECRTPPPPTCEEVCKTRSVWLSRECFLAWEASDQLPADKKQLADCNARVAHWTGQCLDDCKPPPPTCEEKCRIRFSRAIEQCQATFDSCRAPEEVCKANFASCAKTARAELEKCTKDCNPPPPPPTCEGKCQLGFERMAHYCRQTFQCQADDPACLQRLRQCTERAVQWGRNCNEECRDPEPPTCGEDCRRKLSLTWRRCGLIQCPTAAPATTTASPVRALMLAVSAQAEFSVQIEGDIDLGACDVQIACRKKALSDYRSCLVDCEPPQKTCPEECDALEFNRRSACDKLESALSKAACHLVVDRLIDVCYSRCKCTPDECGPPSRAPNFPCADGTMGGPGPCLRDDDSRECAWTSRECPTTKAPSATGFPTRAPCPDGTRPVACLANPCSVTRCPRFPTARCEANYCGGCNAVYFNAAGEDVTEKCYETDPNEVPPTTTPRPTQTFESSPCPAGSPPVECFEEPCARAVCRKFPDAQCTNNYCGTCAAIFSVNGEPVDCTPTVFTRPPRTTAAVKETTPARTTGDVKETTPRRTTGDVKETTPSRTTGDVKETTPKATTGAAKETTPPRRTTGAVKETTPKATTGAVKETTPPRRTTGDVKETTPKATTGDVKETTPKATTGAVKETTPKATTGAVKETTPKATTGDVKETTPERTTPPRDSPATATTTGAVVADTTAADTTAAGTTPKPTRPDECFFRPVPLTHKESPGFCAGSSTCGADARCGLVKGTANQCECADPPAGCDPTTGTAEFSITSSLSADAIVALCPSQLPEIAELLGLDLIQVRCESDFATATNTESKFLMKFRIQAPCPDEDGNSLNNVARLISDDAFINFLKDTFSITEIELLSSDLADDISGASALAWTTAVAVVAIAAFRR